MILNHRVQAGDRRMHVTHLPPDSLVLSPWQGGDVCLERARFVLSVLLHNHNVRIGGSVVGWSWQPSCGATASDSSDVLAKMAPGGEPSMMGPPQAQ